jgi:hypothetical protein
MSASPNLQHVTLRAWGSSGTLSGNYAMYVGCTSDPCSDIPSPTLTDVSLTAWGDDDDVSYGVYCSQCKLTMDDVRISISGDDTSINVGVQTKHSMVTHGPSSWVTMTDAIITVSGGAETYGVNNSYSYSAIRNSAISAGDAITASYGIYNSGSSTPYTVTVNHSQVAGETNAISNNGTGYTTLVGASHLLGGPVAGSGTETCAGVYDEDYVFYPSSCP